MHRRLTFPGGEFLLDRPLIMGVLNVTPDSFSDGGKWLDPDRAVARGFRMRREGADILDVGGESTRPGAPEVPAEEEQRRVLPVIQRLARAGCIVSVDTRKASVARAALCAGAKILNDVGGLRDPAMCRVAAGSGAAVILMHMKGTPRTMQRRPRYRDVVAEISGFFRARLKRALRAGLSHDRIILDPGIGFGKLPEHNLEILRRLREFRRLGRPLAVGTSRKSFIGQALGRPVEDRLWGTAATVAVSVLRGADIVRVHDVREMADVARLAAMLR